MASIQTILRIIPVVSTSMIIQSNFDQQNAFRSMLDRKVLVSSQGKVLPLWYQAFSRIGIPMLGLLYAIGFTVCLLLHFNYPRPSYDDGYYLWCAVFTAEHLIFAPWAWEGIRGSANVSVRPEQNEKALRKWLSVSLIRLFVADLPAWMCAIVALSRSPFL